MLPLSRASAHPLPRGARGKFLLPVGEKVPEGRMRGDKIL